MDFEDFSWQELRESCKRVLTLMVKVLSWVEMPTQGEASSLVSADKAAWKQPQPYMYMLFY